MDQASSKPHAIVPGVAVERLDTAASTNDLARTAIEAGRLDGPRAWISISQTAARGRRGRTWHAPVGGLWMSGAWELPGALIPGLGLRMGAACRDAIIGTLGDLGGDPGGVGLKWPNDVLIDGKKVCGVLCETAHDPRGSTWVIVGVGVNVNNNPAQLPTDLRRPATSLAAHLNRPLAIEDVFQALLETLDTQLRRPEPLADLVARVITFLDGIDYPIDVIGAHGGPSSGILRGLTSDARLVVDIDGRRQFIDPGAELL